jgi:hypothetical protein
MNQVQFDYMLRLKEIESLNWSVEHYKKQAEGLSFEIMRLRTENENLTAKLRKLEELYGSEDNWPLS